MKKLNLKKTLALILCLMMALSAMTLFASADTAPTFAKTIYMSSTGNDSNDGLTEAKAVATIEKATELIGENGGEIILVDDVTQDLSSYDGSPKYVYLKSSLKTIYVHGKRKVDGSYPKLMFSTGGEVATILELASPLAFYDIGLGQVANNKTIWISANGYPLTIGENVTTYMEEGQAINITGGRFNSSKSGVFRAPAEASIVSVYSGVWGQIYGGSYDKNTVQTGGATVNMISGSAAAVHAVRKDSKVTGTATINFYGGSVTGILNRNDATMPTSKDPYKGTGSFAAEGRTNVLNVYNNSMDETTKANLVGVFFGEGALAPVALTGTAPDFWTLSAYSYAAEEPPTFEDDPDLGVNGDDNGDDDLEPNDTKAPETKAPETKAPETEAPAEEEKGCGGVIGASALVIAAVMGTAVVLGKKRED